MHAFVRQRDGQTDGQTDRILIARPRLHSMPRGKKQQESHQCWKLRSQFSRTNFGQYRSHQFVPATWKTDCQKSGTTSATTGYLFLRPSSPSDRLGRLQRSLLPFSIQSVWNCRPTRTCTSSPWTSPRRLILYTTLHVDGENGAALHTNYQIKFITG